MAPAAASAAPAVAVPAGNRQVQLSAMASEAEADAEWQRLVSHMPGLLRGRTPMVQRADVAGRTVWRLRTGGFASIAEATRFCQQVRAQGAGCSIASF
ncbi:MAG TPA: SPOR domain-containing protein [Acetobacteraceae bacterium]|nr:SPOR domain-containing protein [Acetobacteraceae bacterium]